MIILNKRRCYRIDIDGKKCYSYGYAQKLYDSFIKSKRSEITVSLYRYKNDLKPKYRFIIRKDKPLNLNLYLHILSLIEADIKKIRNNAKNIEKRKKEEDYLEMLKKAEKEAEEWYIEYVLEKGQKEDIWLYSLLVDNDDLKEFQYYSPADVVYMAYTLAVLERNSENEIDFERSMSNIADIDIEELVYRFERSCLEHRISPNFHDEKVNSYVKIYEKNPYIKNRILKNYNTYKNLHQVKSKYKTRCRSM